MLKYGDVLTDRNVIKEIDRANRVEKYIDFGMEHVLFVVRVTDILLEKLDFDKEYIDASKIASFLHDIRKKKWRFFTC